jgi:hypothetical protein
MTGTFQIYDDSIFKKAKDGDAVVRPPPVHHETLIQLQTLQQRLNLTDGHMAWIRNVVDEETEALRLGNAELQRENAAFEHMVKRTTPSIIFACTSPRRVACMRRMTEQPNSDIPQLPIKKNRSLN